MSKLKKLITQIITRCFLQCSKSSVDNTSNNNNNRDNLLKPGFLMKNYFGSDKDKERNQNKDHGGKDNTTIS